MQKHEEPLDLVATNIEGIFDHVFDKKETLMNYYKRLLVTGFVLLVREDSCKW